MTGETLTLQGRCLQRFDGRYVAFDPEDDELWFLLMNAWANGHVRYR